MGLLSKMRKQTAVYWALDENPVNEYSQPRYADPVEILVRWEPSEDQIITKEGSSVTASAKVFVGQDMEVGELLMLGELTDLEEDLDPRQQEGALEIRSFNKLPDLKVRNYLRTVML